MNGILEKKKQNASKKKIINSAILLFANKGFDSTSTREICKHAGVNLSLISYYFKTKDSLYTEIIDSIVNYGLEYLKEELLKANNLAKMTCEEKVCLYKTILEKYVDFLYSESVPNSFVVLMLKEQTVAHSKFSELFAKKIDILYKTLRKILASILKKTENDKTVVLEVFSIVGQILSFKFMDKVTLENLKQDVYTREDNKRIIKMVRVYISQSIENLEIKI